MKEVKKRFAVGTVLSLLILCSASVQASKYGRGVYGECLYGGCSITLATSGTVDLSTIPTTGSVYTINNDEVTVTTNSPGGYTLSISSTSDNASSRQLVGPAPSVFEPATGTAAVPATLGLNEWGFRVDAQAGFGSGPTTQLANGASSALTFAGLPLLSTPSVLKTTSTSALSGDTTDVWYGIRATTDNPSGTYTQTVLYTAVSL